VREGSPLIPLTVRSPEQGVLASWSLSPGCERLWNHAPHARPGRRAGAPSQTAPRRRTGSPRRALHPRLTARFELLGPVVRQAFEVFERHPLIHPVSGGGASQRVPRRRPRKSSRSSREISIRNRGIWASLLMSKPYGPMRHGSFRGRGCPGQGGWYASVRLGVHRLHRGHRDSLRHHALGVLDESEQTPQITSVRLPQCGTIARCELI
jgi:hypothetical protein